MPTTDENREARLNALRARFGKNLGVKSQIGGKGSMRRKRRIVRKKDTQADKRLQGALKRLNVNNIPAIEEVNLFRKGDDTVIHFNQPRVQASIAANTYVVSGNCETKKVMEMIPNILPQLGPDNLENLKDMANQIQKMTERENAGGDDDDEVPELVENVNFEDVAAEDPLNDDDSDEVPDLVETVNFDNPVPIAMSTEPNTGDNPTSDPIPDERSHKPEENTPEAEESIPNPESVPIPVADEDATTEVSVAKTTNKPKPEVDTNQEDDVSDANLD